MRLSREHIEDNNSIELQREITTNYAIENGYKIVKEYVDNGYSGILDSRPALDRMMVDISRGIINMLIVKDISRLTRNKNKTGWYTEIFFPDNDVRFISVTELIDSGDRYEIDDTIMLRGIANQYYITDISKKIRANKRAMRDSGQYVEAHTPYGYLLDSNDKHKVVIDKKVEQIIKQIYEMYIDGTTSGKIAEFLNSKKVINPSRYLKMKNATKKWSPETINDILNNPFYCGNTIENKYITDYLKKTCKKNKNKDTWIIKENTHDGIISVEQFNKVQEIKSSKKKQSGTKYEFLLKDLVYCGHCKRKYQYKLFKSADRKRYLYDSSSFKCSKAYKEIDKCKNKTSINEKHINQIVIEEVKKRLELLEIDESTNKIIDYYKENSEEMNKLKYYKNEIDKLERKKSILYKKKCDNMISIDEFKIEYSKIKANILECQNEIEILSATSTNKLDEKKLRKIIQDFKDGKEITNEFLKEIINRIEVYSNLKIEIEFSL